MNKNNAMVNASLQNGVPQLNGQYIGKVPMYFNVNEGKPHLPANYIKVVAGVPFVKANRDE